MSYEVSYASSDEEDAPPHHDLYAPPAAARGHGTFAARPRPKHSDEVRRMFPAMMREQDAFSADQALKRHRRGRPPGPNAPQSERFGYDEELQRLESAKLAADQAILGARQKSQAQMLQDENEQLTKRVTKLEEILSVAKSPSDPNAVFKWNRQTQRLEKVDPSQVKFLIEVMDVNNEKVKMESEADVTRFVDGLSVAFQVREAEFATYRDRMQEHFNQSQAVVREWMVLADNLCDDLGRVAGENNVLQQDVTLLRRSLQAAETLFNEGAEWLDEVSLENENLGTALRNCLQEKSDLTTEESRLRQQHGIFQGVAANRTRELEALRVENQGLQTEVDDLRARVDSTNQECQAGKAQLRATLGELDASVRECEAKRENDKTVCNERIRTLQMNIGRLTLDKEIFRRGSAEFEASESECNVQKGRLELDLARLRGLRNDDRSTHEQELSTQKEELDRRFAELQAECDVAKGELRAEKAQLDADLSDAQGTAVSNARATQENLANLGRVQNELTLVNGRLDECLQSKDKLDQTKTQMEEGLRAEKAQLEGKLQQANLSAHGYNETMLECNENIARVRTALKKAERGLKELKEVERKLLESNEKEKEGSKLYMEGVKAKFESINNLLKGNLKDNDLLVYKGGYKFQLATEDDGIVGDDILYSTEAGQKEVKTWAAARDAITALATTAAERITGLTPEFKRYAESRRAFLEENEDLRNALLEIEQKFALSDSTVIDKELNSYRLGDLVILRFGNDGFQLVDLSKEIVPAPAPAPAPATSATVPSGIQSIPGQKRLLTDGSGPKFGEITLWGGAGDIQVTFNLKGAIFFKTPSGGSSTTSGVEPTETSRGDMFAVLNWLAKTTYYQSGKTWYEFISDTKSDIEFKLKVAGVKEVFNVKIANGVIQYVNGGPDLSNPTDSDANSGGTGQGAGVFVAQAKLVGGKYDWDNHSDVQAMYGSAAQPGSLREKDPDNGLDIETYLNDLKEGRLYDIVAYERDNDGKVVSLAVGNSTQTAKEFMIDPIRRRWFDTLTPENGVFLGNIDIGDKIVLGIDFVSTRLEGKLSDIYANTLFNKMVESVQTEGDVYIILGANKSNMARMLSDTEMFAGKIDSYSRLGFIPLNTTAKPLVGGGILAGDLMSFPAQYERSDETQPVEMVSEEDWEAIESSIIKQKEDAGSAQPYYTEIFRKMATEQWKGIRLKRIDDGGHTQVTMINPKPGRAAKFTKRGSDVASNTFKVVEHAGTYFGSRAMGMSEWSDAAEAYMARRTDMADIDAIFHTDESGASSGDESGSDW